MKSQANRRQDYSPHRKDVFEILIAVAPLWFEEHGTLLRRSPATLASRVKGIPKTSILAIKFGDRVLKLVEGERGGSPTNPRQLRVL